MTNTDAHGSDGTPIQISETERISQLGQIVQQALGSSLPPNEFAALVEIQAKLWRADADLDRALEKKQLEPEEYMDKMASAMAEAMDDSRGLLGLEVFHRIFGDAGLDPHGSIDREAFLHKHV